jgi:hypothetical protein
VFLRVLLALLIASPCMAGLMARGSGGGADVTAPTVSSATIGTNGTTLTLGMSETVNRNGGVVDVDCATAGANLTATYSSGSGSNSLVYTLGTTVNSGDTCDLDYNGAANGIEDAAGNDLAAITSQAITNNSSQGGIGTPQIAWTGDYNGGGTDADRRTATLDGGGTLVGTLSGATIESTQAHGGTYSLFCDASNDDLAFAVTAGDIFTSSAGYGSVWVYTAALTGANMVWEAYNSTTNKAILQINATGTITFNHVGNGTTVGLTTSGTISTGSWQQIEWRWSQASNVIAVRINGGSWQNDADADAVTLYTAEPTLIRLGEQDAGTMTDDIYIDDFEMWTTYDQQ